MTELTEKELRELEEQGLAKKAVLELPIKKLDIAKEEIIEKALEPLAIAQKKNGKGRPFQLCSHGILGKTRCKECIRATRNAYMREYRKRNPDKFKEYKRKYQQTERYQNTRREYYRKNKDKILASNRERLHRMKKEDPERYERFLKQQREHTREYRKRKKNKT